MIFVSIDIVYTSRQFKFSTAYPRNHETLARTNELKKISRHHSCQNYENYVTFS